MEEQKEKEVPKYVKKKRKPALVSISAQKFGLVLDYEVQITLVSEDGKDLENRNVNKSRLIPLRNVLTKNTNISDLATQILSATDLVLASKRSLLEELLSQMKEMLGTKLNKIEEKEDSVRSKRPSLSEIDSYTSLFYEDSIHSILQGSKILFGFVANSQNLDKLKRASGGSWLRVVQRVLQEQSLHLERYSFEENFSLSICKNLLGVVHAFSMYSEFQQFLLDERIGSLCLKILDILCISKQSIENWKEEKNLQHEEQIAEISCVVLKILRNLGKNVSVQKKMHKKAVARQLITFLDSKETVREFSASLLEVVLFLQTLCLYKENIMDIKSLPEETGLLSAVENIFSVPCNMFQGVKEFTLLLNIIHLLTNISFDPELRNLLVQRTKTMSFLFEVYEAYEASRAALESLLCLCSIERSFLFSVSSSRVSFFGKSLIDQLGNNSFSICLAQIISNVATEEESSITLLKLPRFVHVVLKSAIDTDSEVLCLLTRNLSLNLSEKTILFWEKDASTLCEQLFGSNFQSQWVEIAKNVFEGLGQMLNKVLSKKIVENLVSKIVKCFEYNGKVSAKQLNMLELACSLCFHEQAQELCDVTATFNLVTFCRKILFSEEKTKPVYKAHALLFLYRITKQNWLDITSGVVHQFCQEHQLNRTRRGKNCNLSVLEEQLFVLLQERVLRNSKEARKKLDYEKEKESLNLENFIKRSRFVGYFPHLMNVLEQENQDFSFSGSFSLSP
eukprot:snap_masked-scaffold_6-processed-gene-14.12-mRNA-1 protein AED:1.00 eAED:1.00 QI:0/-1/0/0/-1/1/1/0/735